VSAIWRKIRMPPAKGMYSSRSCWPDPVMVTTAGIAALNGATDAAIAGFRLAWTRFGDLGLPWDQALLALAAATTIGPDDPEVAGWLGEARSVFERLRAKPLLAMVDAFAASVWSGRAAVASRAAATSDAGADAKAEVERTN